MNSPHFDINRPVPLARRDVFFERSVELLYMPMQQLQTAERLSHLEQIQTFLNHSERHAFFALRTPNATEQEADFRHFLKLVLESVNSVHAMIRHQLQLESEKGFLSQFLDTSKEDALLPAMHYKRRAEDILQGMWHMLRLAHVPYQALRTANLEELNEVDRERYEKAELSFREEAGKPVVKVPVT